MEQFGRELSLTKERVRQIEARAQGKLRRIAIASHVVTMAQRPPKDI